MTVKLLTEHRMEFLSFKGCWTGSSESTLDKMPHCWKSHVTARLLSEHYQLMLQLLQTTSKSLFIVSGTGCLKEAVQMLGH